MADKKDHKKKIVQGVEREGDREREGEGDIDIGMQANLVHA